MQHRGAVGTSLGSSLVWERGGNPHYRQGLGTHLFVNVPQPGTAK